MRSARMVAATAMLAATLTACSSEPTEEDANGDEIDAQVFCEEFVKERLKSPSTAEFSDQVARQVDGPVWVVTGAVDAQNGFGAMIRDDYRCKMRYLGDGWRLQDLTGLK